jgi:3-methyladenine DNA glycosylase AlkD
MTVSTESIISLTERVRKTQHGFTDIRRTADELAISHSPKQRIALAETLWSSSVHQARMLAVFLYGDTCASYTQNLKTLREVVSRDPDWRVQEILAQAFDTFARDTGYEQSLPVVQSWLADAHPNVRRAVTEGLRIWTSRPFFKQHPELAIQMLSELRTDESEYVRKSVGNALRDISRQHADMVRSTLASWDIINKRVAQVHKLASKFL